LGSAVSFPAGSGAEPHPKANLVHLTLKFNSWWQQLTAMGSEGVL